MRFGLQTGPCPRGRSGAWPSAVAIACAFVLAAGGAHASDATVIQYGSDGTVRVDQVSAGSVSVQQGGAFNQIDVWQLQGSLDAIDALQTGAHNTARLLQTGSPAAGGNLLVLRQGGSGGVVDVQQHGADATAAVFQSSLSTADRAMLVQAASDPVGVIQQGVLRTNPRPLDAATGASAVRSGALTDAASTNSSAILLQAGGAGLTGIIVQAGAGQSAFVSQGGAYLEAEVVQAGGAHTASIVQVGSGTAASPYRASIQQFANQPQSFNIQQTTGSSPRVIRVIQQ